MKKITLLILAFTLTINMFGADYFWVGNSGMWTDYTNHWATTSGGSTFHTQAPTKDDNVYFDANSFTLAMADVSIDMNAYCNTMDWTGVTNNPNLSGWSSLEIYGSLIFSSAMTSTYSSGIIFKSSNIGNVIDFSTVSLSINNIEFNGTGEWSIQSDIDIAAIWGQINITQGTVNFGSNNYNLGMLQSWAISGARNINLQNSNLTLQWLWLANPETINFNAGTSTINLSNNWFDGGGLTYYDVNFNLLWPNEVSINGGNTFHNLGLSSSGVTGVTFEAGKTNTIYDINFSATCMNRKSIHSNNEGQQTTLKKVSGTIQQDYLNIKDIKVIGGASFLTNDGINLGNVSNWTINSSTPRTLYWVGDAGDWSDPSHWSTISGGAYPSAETCVPTDVDDVIFDVNSFSNPFQNVDITSFAFCKSLTCVGVLNSPTINQSSDLNVFGSLQFDAGMTLNLWANINLYSNNVGNLITSAGNNLNTLNFFGTGEWTLTDNLLCENLVVLSGTLSTDNFNISTTNFYVNNDGVKTINLGSSTVDVSNSFEFYGNNLTLNSGTSVINIDGNDFAGNSKIYNNVNLTNTNVVYIWGSNEFNNLTITNGADLVLEENSNTTINSTFSVDGDCSDLVKINSSTEGVVANILISSGIIDLNYVSLKDINASGGATFNAINGVDMGNVTGFNFSALSSLDYYWVGGNGNWSDATHWSLTSGGAPNVGGCIPNQTDNVFFDANSGSAINVAINTVAYCNNMVWTGVNPSAWLYGGSNLNIYGDLVLDNNLTYALTGNLVFLANDAGNSINTFGKSMSNTYVIFNGTGEWNLASNFNMPNLKYIYFNNGTLNTNNYNLTIYALSSWTSNSRTLNLGSSTINTNSWSISNGTNMTINPGTSVLNIAASNFPGGNLTYNDVNITSSSIVSISGANIFNSLDLSNSSSVMFEDGKTQVLSSLTIPSGSGCTDYYEIKSSVAGSPVTISQSSGTFNGDWLNIQDVKIIGGATYNATNSQGVGDVSGWNITGTAPTDYYWVGDGGDWSDAAHWSLSSGGVANPSGCIPTINDNVFFDANSFSTSSQSVNIYQDVLCANMDWTNVSNSPSIFGGSTLTINGSMTLSPNMDLSNYWGMISFSASSLGNTIKTEGHYINGIIMSGSGEYNLTDDVNISWNNFQFNNGTLNTNNFNINITGATFTSNSNNTRILNLGSSIITVNNWDITDATGLTLNAGTSTIELINNPSMFNGGGVNYNHLVVNKNQWGGLSMYGSNTFNTLELKAGAEIYFDSGTIQNTSNLITLGNVNSNVNLYSSNPGFVATINQVAGEFCGDYLKIRDITVTGNTFYAGTNSVDLGNNSGWTFSGVVANNQYPAEMCEDTPGAGTVAGINLTALNSAIDGGNMYTITWYNDINLSSLVVDPTNVTVANMQDFYALVDNGTCTNIAEVIYSVNYSPTLSFISTNAVCNGDSNGAIDLSVVGNSPFTYSWSNLETTQDINSLSAANYTVTVTDKFLCENIGSKTITEPTAFSVDLGVDQILCTTDLLTLDAGNIGLLYLWNDATTNQTLDVDAGALGVGSYDYAVTVTNVTCSKVDSIKIDVNICTEISNVDNQFINVYPNPSSTGIFTISIPQVAGNYKIKIFNSIGKEIIMIENKTEIDLSAFSEGIYFMDFITLNESKNYKLIISKK